MGGPARCQVNESLIAVEDDRRPGNQDPRSLHPQRKPDDKEGEPSQPGLSGPLPLRGGL
jgi:hypothetical protein